jgi:hypothetical protein
MPPFVFDPTQMLFNPTSTGVAAARTLDMRRQSKQMKWIAPSAAHAARFGEDSECAILVVLRPVRRRHGQRPTAEKIRLLNNTL